MHKVLTLKICNMLNEFFVYVYGLVYVRVQVGLDVCFMLVQNRLILDVFCAPLCSCLTEEAGQRPPLPCTWG